MRRRLVVLSPSGWRNPNAVRNVWQLVQRFRPQVFGGVPTVLAAALNVPVGDADVSSMRWCSGGGSAIPVAVGKAYESQFKVPVLEVYGMTETASVHTMSYPDRPVRLGSVGHPVPYSRVRVVQARRRRPLRARLRASTRSAWWPWPGPGVFSRLPERSAQPRRLRRAGLGQFRRPGPAGRRRLPVDHRPRQGPDHPRRPQHRPDRRSRRSCSAIPPWRWPRWWASPTPMPASCRWPMCN